MLASSLASGCSAAPDVKLSGDITVGLVLALALLLIVAVVGAAILLLVLNRTDRELDITIKPLHLGTHARHAEPDRGRELMMDAALARLQDLEQAVVSLVEATDEEIDERAERWFDYVCEGLAFVLAAGTHRRFRVAIWTDDETDHDFLRGLAYHGFDRFDPRYEKLARTESVAGWVIANKREHYVPDVQQDPIYRPRSSKPTYLSMVATPAGPESDPWAVITVDATEKNGLDEDRRALVHRFGVLATVGARIVRIRSARPGRTTDA